MQGFFGLGEESPKSPRVYTLGWLVPYNPHVPYILPITPLSLHNLFYRLYDLYITHFQALDTYRDPLRETTCVSPQESLLFQ